MLAFLALLALLAVLAVLVLLALTLESHWFAIVAVVAILSPIVLFPTFLWAWMLLDCRKNEPEGSNEKRKWMLVILALGPIGAMAYQSTRRKKRIQLYGK